MTTLVCIEAIMGAVKPLNQYIVAGADSWLWIDSGISTTPGEWILPELERRGLTPPAKNLLVVTHADVDHFGGTSALQRAVPGLVTLVHRLDVELLVDREALILRRYDNHRADGIDVPQWRIDELLERAGEPFTVDAVVEGSTEFPFGDGATWHLIHAPGHSDGHVILWEPATRTAVVGDAVMGWGVVNGDGDLQPPHYTDVRRYLETVRMLRDLDVDRMCFSHRSELRGDEVTRFLDESAAAVEAIGDSVARALTAKAADPYLLARVCERVQQESTRWTRTNPEAFVSSVAAHVRDLATVPS